MRPLFVSVFAKPGKTALFDLALFEQGGAEYESAVASAAASGYAFAGTISVVDGAASVHIEPGCSAAMVVAGIPFAEKLGELRKREQLKKGTL